MVDNMKFKQKHSKYKSLPKSASPKSPNEPSEYEDHSYKHREQRPDGSTVYYYDNGVKAIHHPKNTGEKYHRRAVKHHEDESKKAFDVNKYKSALSHMQAAHGHALAASDKSEDSKVEKLYKEFGGTVAVASDPGVFTNTYSGTKSKRKNNSNKKTDKTDSGPLKLSNWLENITEKGMPPPKYISKTNALSDFIINLVKQVSIDLKKQGNEQDTEQRPGAAWADEQDEIATKFHEDLRANPEKYGITFVDDVEKMETDWTREKKENKLTNMPFLNEYKSKEGLRENPPQGEKVKRVLKKNILQGPGRNPRYANDYYNPPNKRKPDPED